jgi:hypothetical protein
MPYPSASAVDIDSKLRDDFRRRLKEYGQATDVTDPILAVLFRTFAQQIESLYNETDRMRLGLLDELIANMGIEPRMARPAQTVVRFFLERGTAVVPAATEFVGEASTGERLTFATDVGFAVSSARIAAAFAYQDGALQTIPSVEMTDALQAVRPSLDPVRVNLGPNPALFLAVDGAPPTHLGQHSLFVDVGPDGYRVSRALESETWCLGGADGTMSAAGILRPTAANGGVQELAWLIPIVNQEHSRNDDDVATVPVGFYGPRVFVLPSIPPERRVMCRCPRGMEPALGRIFGADAQRLFSVDRPWIRISMPRDIPSLRTSITGVTLNAMTASNVECLNQTIVFAQQGASIPVVRAAGGVASHLVAPRSVFGEQGGAYLPEIQPSTDRRVGRYAIRNGRIDLKPALRPDGVEEAYANVRLWVTNGTLGNQVAPGRLAAFLRPQTVAGLRVTNPVAAAGGTDFEEFSSARLRLAEALLSRDRVVTRQDLTHVVRAFDERIQTADIKSGVVRTAHGLQRAEHVRVRVEPGDFVDPAAELPMLQTDLQQHLLDRVPSGVTVSVEVVRQ